MRLFVRELTHTLQFPPAHAELYGGPHAEWLRDCLEYLPRLQCLMVDGLPFFDHASLLSLRYASQRRQSDNSRTFPVFALRLLDASFCKNATSKGLTEVLPHFPDLVSLNLSGTLSARNGEVLGTLKHLSNLRVLSLRNLGLRDVDFSVVARGIMTRVRSLDVSGNQLKDASVRVLLEHCIKKASTEGNVNQYHSQVEDQRPDGPIDPYGNVSLVGHLRNRLMEGFVGSLAVEQIRDDGITHLYLSNNPVTVESIASLLHSGRLQVLDIGLLPPVLSAEGTKSTGVTDHHWEQQDVSKLIPVISKQASANLRYLRANYEIITKDEPLAESSSPRAELSDGSINYGSSRVHELEAAEPPLVELESTDREIFEIAGDSSFPIELPASWSNGSSSVSPSINEQNVRLPTTTSRRAPTLKITVESPEVAQGPTNVPNLVHADSPSGDSNLSSPSRNEVIHPASTSNGYPQILSPLSPYFEHDSTNLLANQGTAPSPCRSTHFVEDRRAQLDMRQFGENCLHPGKLARLHTLVLTGVPTSTTDKKVIDRLIQYIMDAAEETAIATQRAHHTYILPPGRSRAIAEREYVRNLFALRRIVLEIAPPQASPKKKTPSSWRASPTKSSTEDPDSEVFWEAAKHDFSFFSDEEECGLPTHEPGRTLPLAAMSGLEVVVGPSDSTPSPLLPSTTAAKNPKLEHAPLPVYDIVGEIGKFRRDRKAAYDNLLRMGSDVEPDVPGYWPGDITVLRTPTDADAGELDCYGNRFESGWFYR